MPNLIKKTKIKSEGRQPFLTKGGVWLMCLHLTLPSSSAATAGYPRKEGRGNREVQLARKRRTDTTAALRVTSLHLSRDNGTPGTAASLYTRAWVETEHRTVCSRYSTSHAPDFFRTFPSRSSYGFESLGVILMREMLSDTCSWCPSHTAARFLTVREVRSITFPLAVKLCV